MIMVLISIVTAGFSGTESFCRVVGEGEVPATPVRRTSRRRSGHRVESRSMVAMLASHPAAWPAPFSATGQNMTDHQQPQDHAGDTADTKAEQAKSALSEAVAKRTEERKLNDKQQGGGPHGGKPMSNLKVSAQTRGKL
ncbi:hypothetical protein [Lichenifustis flavocetrariae]|uniref:Uncharacterized protein n=1 Tax=Lichenifustis flavocetrariae TaxID=2949735 RepID=A0AA42CN45_9HYPH|nr:hypothetical protein [Lichenifustis flavocetrariae]MCW6513158.1 hypothetical protein [Lichenifustis flavocetrariae]